MKKIAIVGLAFGEGSKTNKELANCVAYFVRHFDHFREEYRPILILQKEITYRLPDDAEMTKFPLNKAIINEKRRLNSYEAMIIAKKKWEEQDISLLYIVAFYAHMPRVKFIVSKMRLDIKVIFESVQAPWPNHDKQIWVRGPVRWWLREIFGAFPYFKLKGWI